MKKNSMSLLFFLIYTACHCSVWVSISADSYSEAIALDKILLFIWLIIPMIFNLSYFVFIENNKIYLPLLIFLISDLILLFVLKHFDNQVELTSSMPKSEDNIIIFMFSILAQSLSYLFSLITYKVWEKIKMLRY